MNVKIKGLDEIPKNCGKCPLAEATAELYCNGYVLSQENRPEWCPLEEVKHGEWINEYYDRSEERWYHTCNQCKQELRLTFCDNYCRNCGAKMDWKESDNAKIH